MMRTRAYENGVPVVFCHYAECLIIDRRGNIVKRAESDRDAIVTAEVEIGRTSSTIDHRRPELYGDLCNPGPV
jgi:predicted amidohydrolase